MRLVAQEDIRDSVKVSELSGHFPWPPTFTGELHTTFQEELTPTLLELHQKSQEEGGLRTSCYEATITLIQNITKK